MSQLITPEQTETVRPLHYSHHDHAGNYADVHKHWLLQLLLRQHLSGTGAFHYIESHSGSGCYPLRATAAENGIARLWRATSLPPTVETYMQCVRHHNTGYELRDYPGSPLFTRYLLRNSDKAILFEKQADVFRRLQQQFEHEPRFELLQGDGFHGVVKRTTEGRQRAFILVDPPYLKQDNDFSRVLTLLKALPPSPSGRVIAVWYPVLSDNSQREFTRNVEQQFGAALWGSELEMNENSNGRMRGSGMLLLHAKTQALREAERDGPALAALLNGRMRYWRPS